MSKINTATELAEHCLWLCKNYKTLYVNGAFCWPMTQTNKARAIAENAYNARPARQIKINAATVNTIGADCCGMIKGILWGFSGDLGKSYGGAVYQSNGVPDVGEDTMINLCHEVSADWNRIEVGEVVWLRGHIGVYVGGGLSVECSPKWADGVQLTATNRDIPGYNRRNWTKHGKLPWVSYTGEDDVLIMTKKEFLESLTPEDVAGMVAKMDTKTAAALVEKAQVYYATLPVPDWAVGEFSSAEDMGITDGTRPMQLIPRYQAAMMAMRAASRLDTGKEAE